MIVAALVAVICLSACGGIKKLEDLKITSADITDIAPDGLKGVKLGLRVGVDNPGAQVSLSNIFCEVKHSGKVLGMVAVDPFTLNAKKEEVYYLKADLKLGENLTLFDAGKLLDKAAADMITVDVRTDVKLKGGISKNLVFNDIPLKKLIETVKK